MSKEHFLGFAAVVFFDRMLLTRLYPEQEAALRVPWIRGGRLYTYCARHGLMEQKL